MKTQNKDIGQVAAESYFGKGSNEPIRGPGNENYSGIPLLQARKEFDRDYISSQRSANNPMEQYFLTKFGGELFKEIGGRYKSDKKYGMIAEAMEKYGNELLQQAEMMKPTVEKYVGSLKG